uniref:FBA_2 domain-containing protein n=1 Tax=Caenorhabditis tropicalis TaxID=1561998 RepID=A0A1I7URP9_9PELO
MFLSNVRTIRSENCHGVTSALLQQFNGASAVLENTNLTNNDFNLLINNWYEGRQPNLKALILWQEARDTIDLATVLRGFEAHPYDEEEDLRARYYFLAPEIAGYSEDHRNLLDCVDGSDIIRPRDGMRCTVRIYMNVFCFYVWHQNFPPAWNPAL